MFTSLNAGVSKRQGRTLCISLALHGLLLSWLLYNPPKFLAPSSVAAGEPGGLVTQLYWPSHPLADGTNAEGSTATLARQQASARKKLEWKKSQRLSKRPIPAQPSPSETEIQAGSASPSNPAAPAGLAYGTSQGGALSGDEIRPALPVSATDPVVSGSDLAGHGEGSVVVEITIDDRGNIVQKVVLQSLGPAVDNKVLAALETWRFTPATRNGVAIPSKQDVYYHFKPTG